MTALEKWCFDTLKNWLLASWANSNQSQFLRTLKRYIFTIVLSLKLLHLLKEFFKITNRNNSDFWLEKPNCFWISWRLLWLFWQITMKTWWIRKKLLFNSILLHFSLFILNFSGQNFGWETNGSKLPKLLQTEFQLEFRVNYSDFTLTPHNGRWWWILN